MFGVDKIGEFLHREEEDIVLLVEISKTVQKAASDVMLETIHLSTVLQLEYQWWPGSPQVDR